MKDYSCSNIFWDLFMDAFIVRLKRSWQFFIHVVLKTMTEQVRYINECIVVRTAYIYLWCFVFNALEMALFFSRDNANIIIHETNEKWPIDSFFFAFLFIYFQNNRNLRHIYYFCILSNSSIRSGSHYVTSQRFMWR